mmetsp:Transcript_31351/g.36057  ORF Transcript_31351/g.36057 Transcript_31351/m.36057 type:complete len:93 (-) Transcript_31351:51-329(-)
MALYIFFSSVEVTAAATLSVLSSSFPPKRPPPRVIPKRRGDPTPAKGVDEVDDDDDDDTKFMAEKVMRIDVNKKFMVSDLVSVGICLNGIFL